MHELALTQRLVEIVVEHAGAAKVQRVAVEIGALAGIVPEAIEMCFSICAADSPAEGAELVIERIPGQGWCAICSALVPMTQLYDLCPHCSGFLEPRDGLEMRVGELIVAKER